MGLVAQVLVALGVDARWAINALLALILTGLIVVLIVIQTIATVLTGSPGSTDSVQTSTAPGATGVPVPGPTLSPPATGDLGTRVIEFAQSWLGVPYVFGGCSRAGVDCSCLVENVYAAVGVHLPRVAVDQYNATSPISDPQPGDLVFFANTYEPGISHVGIYIGTVSRSTPRRLARLSASRPYSPGTGATTTLARAESVRESLAWGPTPGG